NMNGRNSAVAGHVCRVNHDHAFGTGEPNPPVSRDAARVFLNRPVGWLDAVHSVIGHALDAIGFSVGKIIQALPADPKDSPPGVHPKVAQSVGHDRVNVVVEQTVVPVDTADLVALQPGDAGHR